MSILIETVRIANYRAIKNLEVNLSILTLLVGANNAGKSTFLKAVQLALGIDRRPVSKEDFHDDGKTNPEELEILIDIRIVPVNEDGIRIQEFDQLWSESEDFSGNIKQDENDFSYIAFRTKCSFSVLKQAYTIESKVLKQWLDFKNWQDFKNESNSFAKPLSIPLIFMDAQRDIQTDLKDRFSYLGKLTSRPDIPELKIAQIEKELNDLNDKIVNESKTLSHLKGTLIELNKTVNVQGTGVEISPINKKIKDIGRNLNINFQDANTQSFPLENHGMGTRSWASFLTLKAYISWMEENTKPYFPVLALEEPEAHLHPNAQRQLFYQLKNIKGQKIISTHSPFIAAQCDLIDLRHFYKAGNELKVGRILLSDKDEQRIKELLDEIEANGNTIEINKQNRPLISNILVAKRGKINSEESRKIRREVMNTRGELLFAKALILFEGETEEQALPILAREKFNGYPFEMGLNFIGVGGKGNYGPFLSVAKFMNIPWYILSDGDGNTEQEVHSQIKKVFEEIEESRLFVLDKTDFEGYLVDCDFETELKIAIDQTEGIDDYLKNEFIPNLHGKLLKKDENGDSQFRDYKSENGEKKALLDCLRSGKTKYASSIAVQIILKKADGKCILPPKIDELFTQIAKDLNINLI